MTHKTIDSGAPRSIDPDALQALVEQVVGDLGATLNSALAVIGDRLGLYRALATRSQTSQELAEATGTNERNVREWLSAQAANGYVTYDGDSRWSMTPEQAEAFTNEDSPAFVCGGFQAMSAAVKADEKITEAFRTGHGLGWDQHHHDLFEGTERFFRPGYAASLVTDWLPALDGVVERLGQGGRVADVGCGHGASTVLIAAAFPQATVVGFDYHEPSIEAARRAAETAGVSANATFEVAPAASFPGTGYDLVCYFDCLHDMGDPVGALVHARAVLAEDGVVMLVEPAAGDTLEENLNPIGRVFYAASTMICTPASQSQDVGLALGAQAGTARLTAVAEEAGFTRVRVAATTPFNQVLELRR